MSMSKNPLRLNEIESIREHYARFEETLPEALSDELAALEARLGEKRHNGQTDKTY